MSKLRDFAAKKRKIGKYFCKKVKYYTEELCNVHFHSQPFGVAWIEQLLQQYIVVQKTGVNAIICLALFIEELTLSMAVNTKTDLKQLANYFQIYSKLTHF